MEVFTRFVRQLSVILNCPANVVKAYLPDKFALSGKRSFNGQSLGLLGVAPSWRLSTLKGSSTDRSYSLQPWQISCVPIIVLIEIHEKSLAL